MENTAFRDFANTMYKNLLRLQWKSEGKVRHHYHMD